MIPAIHDRLLRWSAWSRIGLDHVGYPPFSPSCRGYVAPYPEPPANRRVPANDAEAMETEAAIRRLCSTHQHAIVAIYLWSGGIEEIAARLCISRRTLFADRDAAHRMLEDILCSQSKVHVDIAHETLLF